jgi:hypothetical protein
MSRTLPPPTVCNATDTSGSGLGKSERLSPWKLMGRVVRDEGLFQDEYVQQGLIRAGAAQAAGLDLDEFERRLEVRCSFNVPLSALSAAATAHEVYSLTRYTDCRTCWH